METCVLIPTEFSLVMCHNDFKGYGNIFELGVTLWANETLAPGTTFDPEEGEAVLDHLECFSALSSKDVRFDYGGEEEIVYVEGQKVRHCNWVRFLRGTDLRQSANIETRKQRGRTVYVVTKLLQPNDELLCYFESSSPNRAIPCENHKQSVSKKKKQFEYYSDEDKENSITYKSDPKIKLSPPTSKKKLKLKRKSLSIFHNTPVRKPFHEVFSPETKREAPCFSSPLMDDICNKSISGLTNTSPSNASEGTGSETSPQTVTSKERSPISEISAGTSPLHISESEPADFHTSPYEGTCTAPKDDDVQISKCDSMSPSNEKYDADIDVNESSLREPAERTTQVTTNEPKKIEQIFQSPESHDLSGNQSRDSMEVTPEEVSSAQAQNKYQNIAYDFSSKVYLDTPNSTLPFRLSNKTYAEIPFPKRAFYGESNDQANNVVRRREKTWLPCEMCGKKFDRPSLLKRHIRTHTGEKPHACDVCGKAFSTSSSLNTHRRIHSGEKPHECQTCGKRFTASSNLYYHRMTHKKEKPHKCTLCAKSFPTPGDLRSHMYVHNGSWPFKCTVCNRGFSKQTNLKNHMLLHSGDKPHCCPICDKKFALQCNLKTHLKTHEEESDNLCGRCGVQLGENHKAPFCQRCIGDNGEATHAQKTAVMSHKPSTPTHFNFMNSPFSMPHAGLHINEQRELGDRMHLYKQQHRGERPVLGQYGMSPVHPVPMHVRTMMADYLRPASWTIKQ